MSAMRKLERQVIRSKCYKRDHNTKAFKSEWEKYHNPRVEVIKADGTIESKISKVRKSGMKKKQRHSDNGKLLVKQLKAFKGFINNLKKEAAEKRSKLESKPVTE